MSTIKHLIPEAFGEIITPIPEVFREPGLSAGTLPEIREILNAGMAMQCEAEREARQNEMGERWQTITGRSGNEIKLLILEPIAREANGPVMVWAHGGGYICGEADCPFARSLSYQSNCTFVSVEYRFAPEHPFPAGVEDMCDAMLWVRDNATELGVDANRIALGGISGGGGLAAGACLMNRDAFREDKSKGVDLHFQFLIFPMLDNTHDTPSGQVLDHPLWTRQVSLAAWEMYLPDKPGKQASPYASAARATDVSNLPPSHISVGELDLFRDECIDYAKKLMAAGVPTQLDAFPHHVHGSEIALPELSYSQRMLETRLQALKDGLAGAF